MSEPAEPATAPDPGSLRARCPACGEELWRERAGQWSLRAAIVKVGANGALVARCPVGRCDGEVPLPWLALRTPPAPAPAPRRRIAMRRLVPVGGA